MERVFTIFRGKDTGKQFSLGELVLALGREEGRDVVLHDERSSRLHAKIVPEAGKVFVVDNGSSNGTFVNGSLVVRREIVEGDVIAIGDTQIVFGRTPPTVDQVRRLIAANQRAKGPGIGATTNVLPGNQPLPPLRKAPTKMSEVLKAVALAGGAPANAHALQLSVENELKPDLALVDPQLLFNALSSLLLLFLERLPAPVAPTPPSAIEDTLALRLAPDPARGGFQVEYILIGPRINRAQFKVRREDDPVVFAQRIAIAHEGTFRFMPPDLPDVLVRFRIPVGPPEELKPTTVQPGG